MVIEDESGGGGKVKRWNRFIRKIFCDTYEYYYLSTYYWEAITFIPQRNIIFQGFSIIGKRDNSVAKYKFKFHIGEYDSSLSGEDAEAYEVELNNDDRDEFMCWSITLKSIGVKPVKVAAGEKLHLCMKAMSDSCCQSHYGYDENYNDYRKNDEQPLDFEIERSDYNQNSTRVDFGQFPFILYS